MSLLMEALRKAEEAKRRSQEQESGAAATAPEPVPAAPAASAFSLEPREPGPPPTLPFADFLAEEDEVQPEPEPAQAQEPEIIEVPRDELEDYLSADPVPEDNVPLRRRPPGGQPTRDQLAAASVFAAKLPSDTDRPAGRRLVLLLTSAFAICIGAGGTLWYLQDMQGSGIAVNPGMVPADIANRGFLGESTGTDADTPADAAATGVAPADTVAAASTGAVTDTVADSGLLPGEGTPPAPLAVDDAQDTAMVQSPQTASAGADDALPLAAAPEDVPALPLAPAAPAPAPATVATSATTAATRTLEISRSTTRRSVNGTLQSAWNSLQAGNLQTAALLYQEVLAEQPNNRDALIGTAAIRLRNGDSTGARNLYAQLLTLNPQDPYARAGLLQATQGNKDPGYESEIKALLQRFPELPPLHFALGNHYAGQQRWSEAQSAYFDALFHAGRDSSAPPSPDYAFNLAVSLEQLQQPGPALNYYRQALELSRASAPGFDPDELQRRLAFLQEQMQP